MNPEPWLASLDRGGFLTARLLLSVLWQSSILLVAAALIACALRRRRASARYILWVSAVLAAPLLPLLGWAASSLDTPRAQLPVMPVYSAPVTAPATAAPALPAVPAPPAPPVESPAPSPLAYPWALALLVYASGAAGLLALVAVGRLRLHRRVRQGRVVTGRRILETFRAARARLGVERALAVVESRGIAGPMTVGAFHPVVLLPAGFAASASDEDLDAVAVHEVAHVKRHDAAVLALLSLVRAVLYVHPLIWLACRQVARLAEAACDDAVLEATGEPVSYAKMLARLAERLPRRALQTELAAGFILSRGAFLKRVEAILSDRRDQIRRLSRAALAFTIVAAAVSVALALALPLGQQTAMQAPKVDTASTTPWGPAVEGVQCRLQADRHAWQAGADPTFKLDIRNQGKREPFIIVFKPETGRITAEAPAAPGTGLSPAPKASAPPPHIIVEAHLFKIPAKAEKQALDTLLRFGADLGRDGDAPLKAGDPHVLLAEEQATALMKDLQGIKAVTVMSAPKLTLFDGQRAHVWIGKSITALLPLVEYFNLPPLVELGNYPKTRVPTEVDVGLGLGLCCTAGEGGRTITVRAVPDISHLVDQTDLPVVERARMEITAPVPVGRTLLLHMPASRFGRFRASGVRRTRDFETGKRTEEVVWEAAGPATAYERILVFITPTIARRPGNEGPQRPVVSP